MSEDKDQIITDLRAEIEKIHSDHDSYFVCNLRYRAECKALQEHLEAEVKKKQADLKKFKEETLKKEKGNAEIKTKLAEMEKDVDVKTVNKEGMQKMIADLNDQLNKLQSSNDGDKLAKLQQEVDGLKVKLQSEAAESESKSKQLAELKTSVQELQESLSKKEEENAKLNHSISALKEDLARVEAQKEEEITQYKSQLAQAALPSKALDAKKSPEPKNLKDSAINSAEKSELKQLRSENERLNGQLEALHRDLAKSKDALALSQSQKARSAKPIYEENAVDMEEFRRLERSFRQLKTKYNDITEEKKNLNRSFREMQRRHQQQLFQLRESSQQRQLNQQQQSSSAVDRLEEARSEKSNNFYVVIRTKKHYVSPFLEWNQRTLKMLKQTKTAFSKSLGMLKYNADWIGYDSNEAATRIVESLDIDNYQQKKMPNSVILFGGKHTSKKQILASILRQLADKLVSLSAKQQGLRIKLHAYKAKLGEPAIFNKQFEESEDLSLSGAFQAVVELFTQEAPEVESSSARKAKLINPTKPKLKEQFRYVGIEFGQDYKLELLTCSNCNHSSFKEHDTLQNSLQSLIYSHLPVELHSNLVSNRHIVLPITPIVQQYDSCKLSLSLINQQHNVPKREKEPENEETDRSPVREEALLNDSVKKKLESFEKETEQASLRIVRLEQDCAYYRSRIEDFVVRIKNIISTQNKQNSYLKKSPMTLTLEKLEQSMSSILRKTSEVGRMSASTFERNDENYGESEHESLLEEPEEEAVEEVRPREQSVDVL